VGITLRVRESLRKQLDDAAAAEHRSLNAELIVRLEQSFKRVENEMLLRMITGSVSENAWLLNMIARCLYVLHGWEQHSDEDRHRSLDAAVSLLIKGIRKFEITPADIGEVRDAEGRGRLLAYNIFNRKIGGKES
jgi:hypothetical protein